MPWFQPMMLTRIALKMTGIAPGVNSGKRGVKSGREFLLNTLPFYARRPE